MKQEVLIGDTNQLTLDFINLLQRRFSKIFQQQTNLKKARGLTFNRD
jgi:hypothetical protein